MFCVSERERERERDRERGGEGEPLAKLGLSKKAKKKFEKNFERADHPN